MRIYNSRSNNRIRIFPRQNPFNGARYWPAVAICVIASFFSAYAQVGAPASPLTQTISAADLDLAERGDLTAQVKVAKAFNEGISVRRNYAEAFKWFGAASKQGSLEASAWLGSLYLQGHGVPQDLGRAASLIQPAADQKDPIGLRFMGIMYETGQGMPRDYSRAAKLFSQAVAKKDPNSFDHLGLMVMRGFGVKKNVRRAARLLTQGAGLGDSWAQLNLGEMYLGGHVPQARTQPSQPVSDLGRAQGNSGTAPKSIPNFNMAFSLFSESAAQGNRVAEFKLAELYQSGKGTAKDLQKALDLYSQSAAQNFAPAQLALGKATELGLGTAVDLVEAYTWYSLAAEQDSVPAAVRLQTLTQKMTPSQITQAQLSFTEVERQRKANRPESISQQ